MDHDRNPDKLLSEPPPEFTPSPTARDRTGSMSLGAPPNANGDEVSPINNGDAMSPTGGNLPPPPPADPNAQAVHEVVNSEVRRSGGGEVV
jgi:hypothetical protein